MVANIALFNSRLLALSLVLLLFNDFYLKFAWPGIISGKLSDFAGISLLSLVLYALFPKMRKLSSLMVIVFFIWWKSEWSSSFIQFLHFAGLDAVNRVVDYSDLLALFVIPLCYYYSINYGATKRTYFGKIYSSIVITLSIFGITATSQIDGNYQSNFQFDNVEENLITSKQAINVVDRVLQYYGYLCKNSCESTVKRKFRSKRGHINYEYNISTHRISINQVVYPKGFNPLSVHDRDDVKFLKKIRMRIADGLKDINSQVKPSITVKPAFYRPSYRDARLVEVPATSVINFLGRSKKLEVNGKKTLKSWADYIVNVNSRSKDSVIVKSFKKLELIGSACSYRGVYSNNRLANQRTQAVREFFLFYGVRDINIVVRPADAKVKTRKAKVGCAKPKRRVTISIMK